MPIVLSNVAIVHAGYCLTITVMLTFQSITIMECGQEDTAPLTFYSTSTASIYLYYITVIHNVGGGLQIQAATPGDLLGAFKITIIYSTFAYNNASGVYIDLALFIDAHYDVTISNATFSHNSANEGGGLYILSYVCTNITILDSTFVNNMAGGGGGLYIGYSFAKCNAIGIINSTFVNNDIDISSGGGLLIVLTDSHNDIVIDNGTFANNKGGLYIESSNTTNKITLKNSLFNSNNESGLYISMITKAEFEGMNGSCSCSNIIFICNTTFTKHVGAHGLYIDSQPYTYNDITIIDSTFTHNSGSENGGGLCVYSEHDTSSVITIVNSIFATNSAASVGGGIYVNTESYYAINIIGSAITDNNAIYGGGMMVQITTDTPCNITINDTTFTSNSANVDGGGLCISGYHMRIAITAADSNFTNNSANGTGGGGLTIISDTEMYDIIKNSVFINNNGSGLNISPQILTY